MSTDGAARAPIERQISFVQGHGGRRFLSCGSSEDKIIVFSQVGL
jgi:hypothetical protein